MILEELNVGDCFIFIAFPAIKFIVVGDGPDSTKDEKSLYVECHNGRSLQEWFKHRKVRLISEEEFSKYEATIGTKSR